MKVVNQRRSLHLHPRELPLYFLFCLSRRIETLKISIFVHPESPFNKEVPPYLPFSTSFSHCRTKLNIKTETHFTCLLDPLYSLLSDSTTVSVLRNPGRNSRTTTVLPTLSPSCTSRHPESISRRKEGVPLCPKRRRSDPPQPPVVLADLIR